MKLLHSIKFSIECNSIAIQLCQTHKDKVVLELQRRRGGSNEYLQSMFLSRNKKNNVYPCKPKFYYIKVGFKGIKIIQVCFRDGLML